MHQLSSTYQWSVFLAREGIMARRRVHVKKGTVAQQQARQLKQLQDRALADAWMREHPRARMVIYAISFALVVFVVIAVWFGVQSVNAGVSSTPTPTVTVDTSVSLQAAASSPTQVATAKPTVKVTVKSTHQATPIPTHQVTPTPTHQVTPNPTPSPTQPPACQPVNENPWCYDFLPGNLITNPPGDFCSYFNCTDNFVSADDPDGGYVVECQDMTFSQSGGERGACKHQGGEMRPLYSH
jgi:hypothetical protein